MNYLPLIIAAVLGIVLGAYFARRKSNLITVQGKRKTGNKAKIQEFLQAEGKNGAKDGRATNDDIQKLLGVSDATATRYMDQLEKQGKVRQIGTTGQGVYYVLK